MNEQIQALRKIQSLCESMMHICNIAISDVDCRDALVARLSDFFDRLEETMMEL